MTTPTNRPASLHAYLSYRDAHAARAWLEQAFGFETTMQYPDDKGGLQHCELRRDEMAIVLFSAESPYDRPARIGETVGHGLYVAMPDEAAVDAVYASSAAANAEVVWEPGTTEWGNYRFRAVDPEGYEWTFGTHKPGEPAADWSDQEWDADGS